MALDKNMTMEVTIEGIGINGEGIARVDNIPVFVPFALPGEKVIIKILANKKSHAYAKIVELLAPADERAREECPVFSKCGGCQIQHMKYKDQLAFKTILVSDTLKKIAKQNFTVLSCVKSELKYGYRNKLQLPVSNSQDNTHPIFGFYASSSHRIVPIHTCPLHPEWNKRVISIMKKFMIDNRVSGYNEDKHTGIIRHIVARILGNHLQLTIVINAESLPHSDLLIELVNDEFKDASIFLNINTEKTNVILSNKYIQLSGEADVLIEDMNHRVLVSPNSFMQVNNQIKSRLYTKALELSEVTENDVVIDAYCGIGIMTSLFAEKAHHAFGIEIVMQAIENANFLANENGLSRKMTNILGDCGVILPEVIASAKNMTQGEVILILDPPRKGVEKRVIDTILSNLPDKIIYISCNPATLARDIGMLTGTIDMDGYKATDGKYKLTYVQPYDMFPQTKHVETLCCLKRILD